MEQGSCDPRFEAVREAFVANFGQHGDVGAACAVMIDGVLVVDLWGGRHHPTGQSWDRDTMVETRSVTKGVTALCMHLLADRGAIDLDAPLRRYWPELRADPLVSHALSHSAGIPVIDAALPPNAIVDWDLMAAAVAAQEPMWEPGERHGYHGVTFGWLVGEAVRRVTGESIGRFLRREVTGPLGVDYFIGTPHTLHHRVAPLLAPSAPAPDSTRTNQGTSTLAVRMYAPVLPPLAPPANSRAFREAEIPVANGIGTARALATVYGDLARPTGRLVSAEGVRRMSAEVVAGADAILGVPVRRSLGFELPIPWVDDGRPSHAFGHAGAGGSIAFADAEARLGFAYVTNQLWSGGTSGRDPRAPSLIRAVYASL